MSDLNSVSLIGRLTRDAEVRHTAGGMPITNLSLAVNSREKRGNEWTEKPNFIDIVLFGDRYEKLAAKALKKGDRIAVQGSLSYSSWETPNGNRNKLEVKGQEVQLLGSAGGSGGAPAKKQSSAAEETFGGEAKDPFAGEQVQGDDSDIPF